MKYVVLILAVLVISASAAVAHDVAAAYGTKGMSGQATLAAACETAQAKAGRALVAMLGRDGGHMKNRAWVRMRAKVSWRWSGADGTVPEPAWGFASNRVPMKPPGQVIAVLGYA